jgi:hypothetical protein
MKSFLGELKIVTAKRRALAEPRESVGHSQDFLERVEGLWR